LPILSFSFNVANEEVDGVRKEKERLTTDHQPISDQAKEIKNRKRETNP
jgi:hypothetical protein